MEIFSTFNITMAAVMISLYFCVRTLFSYRLILAQALTFTTAPIVKEKFANLNSFKETLEQAQDEYALYDVFWIPFCYIVYMLLLLLWVGISMGYDSAWYITLVAGAASLVFTRTFTHQSRPVWLMNWMVDMMHTINTYEYTASKEKIDAMAARVAMFLEKTQSGEELTDEEQEEVLQLVISAEFMRMKYDQAEQAYNSTLLYIENKKKGELEKIE